MLNRHVYIDRAKQATISRIELYTRYTSTIWGMLHEQEVKVPSRNAWPAGVSLPPTTSRSQETKPAPHKEPGTLDNTLAGAKKPSTEKETEEVRVPVLHETLHNMLIHISQVLPPFDLSLFVKSQEHR